MDKERFAQLFERYLNNTITAEELHEISEAIRDKEHEQLWDAMLKDAFSNPSFAKDDRDSRADVYQNLLSIIREEPQRVTGRRIPIAYRWMAGVAAALVLAFGITLFYHPKPSQQSQQPLYVNDVSPGSNKATLTLANGTKLILGDTLEGHLANEAGVQVTKTKNGEIIYTVNANEQANNGQPQYNVLSTVKKEQYQIVLADGTHVWLNASSSLKYPTTFSGKERKVELSGEAYFEVAHNATHPFIVKTSSQEVEVLGTHFNVNAYPDEQAAKTTLLEGSVRVHASGLIKTLQPDQQAVNTGSSLTIKNVDTEEAVAWKNGYFLFDDEDLSSVTRKLSRWYDVEFVYADSNQVKQVFAGSITRYTNVSKVLSLLEKAGNIHFTIEGQKITVHK